MDETGTYEVYETVAQSDVDVHVYGVGNADPAATLPVTAHTGTSHAYRKSWFVVFTPSGDGDAPTTTDHAALVALETDPNVWDGFWTFRPELVARIDRYIAENV